MTQKLRIYSEEAFIDLDKVALCVQNALKQKVKMYIDLTFVSQDEIRRINRENRNVDSVTDVLSFPTLDNVRGKTIKTSDFLNDYDHDEKALFLGDIAICPDRAREQAAEYGHSFEREINYLLVHGILHLFGYDHITEEDKKEMRIKEEEILHKLGVTR
ncbi:MAG: rRNA maturation RNase YbeY [Christensenellaceae bacterium]